MRKGFMGALVGALIFACSFAAHAQNMSDYMEGKLVALMQGTSFTAPATLYVGLSTTACSDSSVGTEVSGGSYARVAVTSNTTNWTGPVSGDGTATNGTAITFPAPTANWGTITSAFISDASTGGNMLICKSLTAAKNVNNGDAAPSFAIGGFTVTFQ